MPHLALVGEREQLLIDLVLGDGGKTQRSDELSAAPGQDHPEREATLAPAPDEFQRLVGGDAAGHDQQDPLPRQHWTSKFHSSNKYLVRKLLIFKFSGRPCRGSAD